MKLINYNKDSHVAALSCLGCMGLCVAIVIFIALLAKLFIWVLQW
jgi:hypothetical protein